MYTVCFPLICRYAATPLCSQTMKTYSRSTRARRTLSVTTGIRSDLLIGILQTPLLLQTAEVSKGAGPEIL
jgi:hypothetical protein